MRRSWIALVVIAALTAIACAHPTEDPLPGEPTPSATRARSTDPAPSGSDQTEQVCEEALDRSHEVVDEIRDKIADAQANPGNATTALLSVRAIATEWKNDLEDFADRPIRRDVRDAINQGIDVIDDLLATNPQRLASEADEAQQKIEDFLDDLESACR
jgi:hypothetical protein